MHPEELLTYAALMTFFTNNGPIRTVMVVVPFFFAVSKPALSTDITLGFEETNVTLSPVALGWLRLTVVFFVSPTIIFFGATTFAFSILTALLEMII